MYLYANVYHYDRDTKEYLGSSLVEGDPEESKIRGELVPLVPANATLIQPPEYEENEVVVFNGEVWEIKPDYRKNFYKVNENFEVEEITTIGEQEGYYIVTKEIGEEIKENSNLFKIANNKIKKKTEKELENERLQAEKEQKELEEKLKEENKAMLSLTKREVFLALYRDKGITPEQIKSQITDTEALIEFEYADKYYRYNPLIDTIGHQLGYTSEQLDYLFENKGF